jgi:hypothetical protein
MGWVHLRRLCFPVRRAARPRGANALLAAAALAPLPALAQQGDDATAQTLISIQEPGSITNTQDMHFGQIIQPNAPGTVILAPGASSTCTTTGGLVRSGLCRAAGFSIFGRRNWRTRIRETNGGTVTLTGPGGATMTMDTITIAYSGMSPSNGANGWNLGRYNIDSGNGIANFWLGGRLNVGAAQAPGVYHGTLVVQIQFN